jgi:hypothetical protein
MLEDVPAADLVVFVRLLVIESASASPAGDEIVESPFLTAFAAII